MFVARQLVWAVIIETVAIILMSCAHELDQLTSDTGDTWIKSPWICSVAETSSNISRTPLSRSVADLWIHRCWQCQVTAMGPSLGEEDGGTATPSPSSPCNVWFFGFGLNFWAPHVAMAHGWAMDVDMEVSSPAYMVSTAPLISRNWYIFLRGLLLWIASWLFVVRCLAITYQYPSVSKHNWSFLTSMDNEYAGIWTMITIDWGLALLP